MKLTMRKFNNEDDYWRIRAFLRQTAQDNNLKEYSWPVPRLDYWRWHVIYTHEAYQMEDVIFIWEDESGEIAAVLNPEGPADAYLNVRPKARSRTLETEMIETAEQYLTGSTPEGGRRLIVWAYEDDPLRQEILQNRGYERIDRPDVCANQHLLWLDQPLPYYPPAPGYTVRSLGGPEEIPSRSWASWRAFHPDDPDEKYQGWDWYPVNIQQEPLYRRDLDIVAIAPDGEVAAFCTFWFDDVTRSAYIEPVGTRPAHQKKGLGKAVITEGLRRLKAMGGLAASVHGFSVPANKLYNAAVSPDCILASPWRKIWEPNG